MTAPLIHTPTRSLQVHWCGFDINWHWDFGDGEGPRDIELHVTASGYGRTIHSIELDGEYLDGATTDLIAAVLENDSKFRDYADTRFAEEAEGL